MSSQANNERTTNKRPPQQFLRVRRTDKDAAPANCLRLGLDATSALANLGLSEASSSAQQRSKSSSTSVLFRRVEHLPDVMDSTDDDGGDQRDNNKKKRRIVDAVLLPSNSSNSNNKRQKRTLQLVESFPESNKKKRKNKQQQEQQQQQRVAASYPVLTPEQRQVDDSLKALFQGNRFVSEHVQLLKSSMAYSSSSSSSSSWPWTWCGPDGNWLHACALWNQAATARAELNRLQQQQQVIIIKQLLQAVNSDGQTPLEIAQQTGHVEMQSVLESFYNQVEMTAAAIMDKDDDDDEEYYEYDMYCCLDGEDDNVDAIRNENDLTNGVVAKDQDVQDDDFILECELHDECMGYWDERGQLVLTTTVTADTSPGMDGNRHDDGDDYDSNEEDCDRNDYPEDDCWSNSTNASSSLSSENSSTKNDYRHRPVHFEDGEDYDAAYGGIYGQHDIEEYDDEC